MRITPVPVALGTLVLLGTAAVVFQQGKTGTEKRTLSQAQVAVQKGDMNAARQLLHSRVPSESEAPEWHKSEATVLAQTGEIGELVSLYRADPGAIEEQEHAAVLAARGLLIAKDEPAYKELVDKWATKKKHPAWWFGLEVDKLIREHKPDAARKRLQETHFDGPDDATRLMRLALLRKTNTPEGLKAAWADLQKAVKVAPNDADLHSLRAQIIERLGVLPYAFEEYTTAWRLAPKSPYHADQLAEFFRRQGDYAKAVQTWRAAESDTPAEYLRVKGEFWSRITRAVPSPGNVLPPGPLTELADWLSALPKERFFDEKTFPSLPTAVALEKTRQEILWLRITEALRTGDEDQAAHRLRTNPFRSGSWNPELERLLAITLRFRHPELQAIPLASRPADPSLAQQPLVAALEAWNKSGKRPDAKTEALLKGPDAFAAAYLATGWWEAALRLRATEDLTAPYPSWFAYGATQALRTMGHPDEALAFIEKQSETTPALQLAHAETLLTLGRSEEGLPLLDKLIPEGKGVGYRAAYLMAVGQAEIGKSHDALITLARQPELAQSAEGKALAKALGAH